MRPAGCEHRPGDAWSSEWAPAEPDRQGVPLSGAPGWHVVERPKQLAQAMDPEPVPDPRAQALAPLAAGAALSVVVLTLAFFDRGWPDGLTGGFGPVTEPAVVVGTIDDLTPPAVASAVRPAAPAAGPTIALGGPDGASAPGEVAARPPLEPPSSAAPSPVASASAVLAATTSPDPVAENRTPPIPVLRPAGLAQEERDRSATGRAGAAPAGIVQAAYGEPAPQGGDAAAHAGIRVFIHYTVGHDDELARRLAAFLELRGFTVADVRPVSFPIGEAGLRYFFDRDRDDSQRLLEEIDWFFEGMPERAPHQASDFTHYTPRPRPGNVEVWLPTS